MSDRSEYFQILRISFFISLIRLLSVSCSLSRSYPFFCVLWTDVLFSFFVFLCLWVTHSLFASLWTSLYVYGYTHMYMHCLMWLIVSVMQRAQWVKPPGHVHLSSTCCIESPVKPCQISVSTGDSSQLSCCGWTPTRQGWALSMSRSFPSRGGNFITYSVLIKACSVTISVFHQRGWWDVPRPGYCYVLGRIQKSESMFTISLHGRFLVHLGHRK